MNGNEPAFLSLLHISDLHFGPPFHPEVAAALLRLAPTLNVQGIIVSGDLTQRAKREQFIDARRFLDQLPRLPTLVIPGNHDVPLYRIWERFANPHGLYKQYITDDLQPILRVNDAVIIGIDSTAPRTAITNGRISRRQLEQVAAAFQAAGEAKIRIVVAHHPFAPAPDILKDKRMPFSQRAIQQFEELNVEVILGGHLHRAYIGNTLDFYPGRHRDRGIIIVQCGTTTSRRGRGRESEKNTFNVLEIFATTIVVNHYMYFSQSDAFEKISCHIFRRFATN